MSQFLLDVNLQQVPDQYLTGTWRVADRVFNRADPQTPLGQATHLALRPGRLHLQTPTVPATGQWWCCATTCLITRTCNWYWATK